MTAEALRGGSRLVTGARAAAGASLLAALVHLYVVPEHRAEWALFGMFFTAVAAFEVVWAALAWADPTRLVLVVGVVANLGVLAVWTVSRTTGLPFGPEPWKAEPAGALDVACCLAEAVTVVCAARAMSFRHRAR